MDWNLLRTFDTVARLGSLTAAASTMGVNQSTVSRQLKALEDEAGSPLLVRSSPIELTARGQSLLVAMAPMITGALHARAALDSAVIPEGEVTVTTMGEFVRWVLSDHLPSFYAQHPGLRLRILADNRMASLAAGEADIALRGARPTRGDLIAQRLLVETYGWFAAPELLLHADTPWLGLAGSLAQIPEQQYAEQAFGRPARLLVEDLEALGKATTAGLGVAVLPRTYALMMKLSEIDPATVGAKADAPPQPREFWMVVHRAKQHLPKVRAVSEWLRQAVTQSSLTTP